MIDALRLLFAEDTPDGLREFLALDLGLGLLAGDLVFGAVTDSSMFLVQASVTLLGTAVGAMLSLLGIIVNGTTVVVAMMGTLAVVSLLHPMLYVYAPRTYIRRWPPGSDVTAAAATDAPPMFIGDEEGKEVNDDR